MAARADEIGVAEIADLFGVDSETIRLWRQRGMPHRMVSNRPRFVAGKCVQWRRAEDQREQRAQTNPKEADERARKLGWDADMAELKYREKLGQLAPVADVERQTARLCSAVRARVLAVRGRWAPRAIGLENMIESSALFDKVAADILAALEETGDEIENDDESIADTPDTLDREGAA
jgi:phage terminase Nu1 subunit (DNA packaging protein)